MPKWVPLPSLPLHCPMMSVEAMGFLSHQIPSRFWGAFKFSRPSFTPDCASMWIFLGESTVSCCFLIFCVLYPVTLIAATAATKSLQSCPTLWPHRRQPTRLLHPWDSPGKNAGVGCHFLLQCMRVKSESEVAQLCLTVATPWTAAYQAPPSMGVSRQEHWSGLPLPSLVTLIRL